MSWIADAHNEWHTVNGWDVCCPLDCGVGEGSDDYYIPEQEDPAEVPAEPEGPEAEGPAEDDYVSSRDLDEAAGQAEDRDFAAWGW